MRAANTEKSFQHSMWYPAIYTQNILSPSYNSAIIKSLNSSSNKKQTPHPQKKKKKNDNAKIMKRKKVIRLWKEERMVRWMNEWMNVNGRKDEVECFVISHKFYEEVIAGVWVHIVTMMKCRFLCLFGFNNSLNRLNMLIKFNKIIKSVKWSSSEKEGLWLWCLICVVVQIWMKWGYVEILKHQQQNERSFIYYYDFSRTLLYSFRFVRGRGLFLWIFIEYTDKRMKDLYTLTKGNWIELKLNESQNDPI